MTKHILYVSALVLCLAMSACSNSNPNTISASPLDTAHVLVLEKKDTSATINEVSSTTFLSQAQEIHVSKKGNRPFNQLDYNKVIAYDYEGGKGEGVLDIITIGKLAPTVKQQKELTQTQVDDLTNFLGANSTYGGGKAFCFDPHLGIVFYKDNQVVAHVSICLECNYLSSSINIPATSAKKIKMDDDLEYPADGFSKLGRQKINALCKQLNFSHCADTLNSMFDE